LTSPDAQNIFVERDFASCFSFLQVPPGRQPVHSLSLQVARWLPQAGFAPPALRARAAFRMSKRGGGIPGAAYLLRLSLSPTDEDCQKGERDGRPWLWDALLQPLRLPEVRIQWPCPYLISRIAEAQMRTGPQNDHGPAPEDCVLSLQISSMTLGANVFLRRWKFHAQVQRVLIAKHAQRQ
jgi:hypothetical protein